MIGKWYNLSKFCGTIQSILITYEQRPNMPYMNYGLQSPSKSTSPTKSPIAAFTPSKLSPSLKIVSRLKGDYDDVRLFYWR